MPLSPTKPSSRARAVLLQRGGSRSGGRGNSVLVFIPGILLVLGVFALTQHMASFRSTGHRVSYAYHHHPAAPVVQIPQQVSVRSVLDCPALTHRSSVSHQGTKIRKTLRAHGRCGATQGSEGVPMFATEVRLTTCVPDHIHIAPSGSATQLEMT